MRVCYPRIDGRPDAEGEITSGVRLSHKIINAELAKRSWKGAAYARWRSPNGFVVGKGTTKPAFDEYSLVVSQIARLMYGMVRHRVRSLIQDTEFPTDYGRDHHPRCFTMWMASGWDPVLERPARRS